MNFYKAKRLYLPSNLEIKIKTQMIFFCLFFSMFSCSMMFWKFQKYSRQKQHDGVYVYLCCMLQHRWGHFSDNVLALSEEITIRAIHVTAFELDDIFSLNFPTIHFSCLGIFAARNSYYDFTWDNQIWLNKVLSRQKRFVLLALPNFDQFRGS